MRPRSDVIREPAVSRPAQRDRSERLARRAGRNQHAKSKAEKIDVENVNTRGSVRSVDAEMYAAMKQAFLETLPKESPGPTLAEIRERLLAHLPDDLFPGGAKAGWWAKTVQLDLEAKGIIVREKTTPLRLHRSVSVAGRTARTGIAASTRLRAPARALARRIFPSRQILRPTPNV